MSRDRRGDRRSSGRRSTQRRWQMIGLLSRRVWVDGGVEVDTQGDAFFVASPTAADALAAAREATEALAAGTIRVRIGLHTGTALAGSPGTYVGTDVHRAARIAPAAHGGQVLVSASTRELVEGVELRDLGEHRFKDLVAAERVMELGMAISPPICLALPHESASAGNRVSGSRERTGGGR